MALILTPEQKAERRKLRDDFEYWAANHYTIINKEGELVKLVLNVAQRHILSYVTRATVLGKPIRLVVLKGRQQGASTLIEAWQLWRVTQAKAKRAFVLAHDADATTTIFGQAKLGYDKLPDHLKPSVKASNKRELAFGGLDSSITVATAGGVSIGRSKTLQYVHASEVGFWAASSAEKNWNGLHQCVPNVPDSAIFVESTAQGMGNLFHRLWSDAEKGASEFDPVFVPWFWQPEYRLEAPADFERTPEERKVGEKFGLDDDQLFWRRRKIAAVGRDLFNQEYPNTPQDAFLTSGRPVFDPVLLYPRIDEAPQPLYRMAMETNEHNEDEFVEHSLGELLVYVKPELGGTYYVGADVAEGLRTGDYSVAQVLDGSKRQVAVWRGHIYPDAFANVLAALGRLYNEATVAVELNNHGILTANVLAKTLEYPGVWTDTVVDKITDEETVRLGFTETKLTRPMILNKLRADVRDWTIKIYDEVTLKEMLTFVVTPADRMEAENGAHDDHVMALAIANHINEGEWITYRTNPKHYIEVP